MNQDTTLRESMRRLMQDLPDMDDLTLVAAHALFDRRGDAENRELVADEMQRRQMQEKEAT